MPTNSVEHASCDKNLCLLVDPVRVPDRGMGEYFFEKMKENSHKIAQIDSVTGRKETYGEFLSRCIRAAQTLKARGITSEDVVSFCTFNNMDNVVPYVACMFLNVKVACLDPATPLIETVHQIKLVRPKMMFCEEDSVPLVEATLKKAGIDIEIVVFGETDKHTPFSTFLSSAGSENDFQVTPIKDLHSTLAIIFSSGTTGLPKGTCVTHYAIYYNNYVPPELAAGIHTFGIFTSPYWIGNLCNLVVATLIGATRIVCKKFYETKSIKILQDYKVNLTNFTPIQLDPLIRNPQYCDYDTSELKLIFIVGSPIGVNRIAEVSKRFPHSKLINAYGMSETGGAMLAVTPLDITKVLRTKKATAGRPAPGICYKIIDDDGNRVGPNTPGELRVKTATVLAGYYKQPELFAQAFDNEGYLKTGDLLYYDEDYQFYVVDRVKEIFKYRTWHISPSVIENELLTHSNVELAAVIGIPHEVDCERPAGIVVLKKGASTRPEAIVKYVNERMADRFHLRGGVFIVDSIPTTPSNKIKRKELRNMILNLINKS